MLPVASPTNAIVFASGHIRIIDMVKLNLKKKVSFIKLIPKFIGKHRSSNEYHRYKCYISCE
jgi:hypothetical protein